MGVLQEIVEIHHYCLLNVFGESLQLFGLAPEIGESLAMVLCLG